jgi:large subunit ribosomal protein L10
MAKTKEQKQELVKFYKDRLGGSKATYFIEAEGITSTESTEIKKGLFDLNSTFHVIKNRLFKLAIKEQNLPELAEIEKGAHAAVFADDADITSAAKVIVDFLKEKEDLKIKIGLLDGEKITEKQIIELASLPGMDEMRAKLAGTLNAPISGFTNVLAANVRGIVNVLNAIKDTKENS